MIIPNETEEAFEKNNINSWLKKKKKKQTFRDFPAGPVAKTPLSQCRGSRFVPWSGN